MLARPDASASKPGRPESQVAATSTAAPTDGRWVCPTLLPTDGKDHKLQFATDRSAKKSLCVLCASSVRSVSLW